MKVIPFYSPKFTLFSGAGAEGVLESDSLENLQKPIFLKNNSFSWKS